MWQFLNQYGWYFLIFGLMFLMHRRGGSGGCGGHQHGKKNQQEQHETKQPIPFEQKK